MLIGGDGHAAIGALGVDAIIDALTVEPAGGALLAQGGLERYKIEAG